MSLVTVEQMIRSMSSGERPLDSRAFFAAEVAISRFDVTVLILRSPIPVRSRIHSSLVATIRDKASLVRTKSGIYEPVAIILARSVLDFMKDIPFPVVDLFTFSTQYAVCINAFIFYHSN